MEIKKASQESVFLFLNNGITYHYYPYICNSIDNVQQVIEKSIYPGFSGVNFTGGHNSNFGVGQLWIYISSLSDRVSLVTLLVELIHV